MQEGDDASLLHHTRAMLSLRRATPALHHGTVVRCETVGGLFVIERRAQNQTVRCLFNLGSGAAAAPGDLATGCVLAAINGATSANLPPLSAMVIEL